MKKGIPKSQEIQKVTMVELGKPLINGRGRELEHLIRISIGLRGSII